jgi:hypothetical protein
VRETKKEVIGLLDQLGANCLAKFLELEDFAIFLVPSPKMGMPLRIDLINTI